MQVMKDWTSPPHTPPIDLCFVQVAVLAARSQKKPGVHCPSF
jgi:hypothetical protein